MSTWRKISGGAGAVNYKIAQYRRWWTYGAVDRIRARYLNGSGFVNAQSWASKGYWVLHIHGPAAKYVSWMMTSSTKVSEVHAWIRLLARLAKQGWTPELKTIFELGVTRPRYGFDGPPPLYSTHCWKEGAIKQDGILPPGTS